MSGPVRASLPMGVEGGRGLLLVGATDMSANTYLLTYLLTYSMKQSPS